jgi:hypothetical protein
MISAGLFAAMIIFAITGNALISSGVIKNFGPLQLPVQILFFSIFIAFGFSMIPVMVKTVISFQVQAGNENAPVIGAMIRNENRIIWTFWILILLGLVIALPVAIQQGFMSSDDSKPEYKDPFANTPIQGIVVAAPGMTVDEVVKLSSLKLDRGATTIAGGALFDYKIPNTAIDFPRCRYYFMSTYIHDESRVKSINIGTSPSKLTRAQLEAADASLRARLKADGWLTGHEVYRDEQDQQLHGGKTRGEEGRLWEKNGIVLDIERRRLDDPAPNEDTATAGDWIQYIDLSLHKEYPWIERYVFAPPET